jgi:hypothetical protein
VVSIVGILVFVGLTAWDTQSIKEQYAENFTRNRSRSSPCSAHSRSPELHQHLPAAAELHRRAGRMNLPCNMEYRDDG